jgi:hypothetical protein
MAHQQRIMFQRRDSRRHFQTHPLEHAASIPGDVGNRVSRPQIVRSREAPCRRGHMAQIRQIRLAKARRMRSRQSFPVKDWRRIATRYDKLARNFLAAATLIGALYWIKL